MSFFPRARLCDCESGLYRYPVHDAQNIFLCYACDKCLAEKLEGYRPEILTGYTQADVDEPIEAE